MASYLKEKNPPLDVIKPGSSGSSTASQPKCQDIEVCCKAQVYSQGNQARRLENKSQLEKGATRLSFWAGVTKLKVGLLKGQQAPTLAHAQLKSRWSYPVLSSSAETKRNWFEVSRKQLRHTSYYLAYLLFEDVSLQRCLISKGRWNGFNPWFQCHVNYTQLLPPRKSQQLILDRKNTYLGHTFAFVIPLF